MHNCQWWEANPETVRMSPKQREELANKRQREWEQQLEQMSKRKSRPTSMRSDDNKTIAKGAARRTTRGSR